MNWSALVGNGDRSSLSSETRRCLFNRIGGRTVNNVVLISDIDPGLGRIKSRSTVRAVQIPGAAPRPWLVPMVCDSTAYSFSLALSLNR
jgi:hypothetical protein